jgi:hypothetical protein
MHELKEFKPIGLNRDETLLAMGRAGARPNRVWQLACAGLVATHFITAAVAWWCWPRTADPVVVDALPVETEPFIVTQPDPSSVIVLSRGLDSLPTNAGAMLSYPPLRAGSSGME